MAVGGGGGLKKQKTVTPQPLKSVAGKRLVNGKWVDVTPQGVVKIALPPAKGGIVGGAKAAIRSGGAPPQFPSSPTATNPSGGGGGILNQAKAIAQRANATPIPVPGPMGGGGFSPGVGGSSGPGGAGLLSYSGTGGGVGGNAGTSNLTSGLTGFASQYAPDTLQALLANPSLIAQGLMTQRGMDPLGQGAGMLELARPYMDAARALMPLAWGGALPGTPSAPVNWLANEAGQGMTPGGSAIDFRDVMKLMGSLGTDTAAGAQMWGGGMSPQDQINATKQIVYGAAQAGLPPEFQRAVQNMMNTQANAFLQNQYQGGTPTSFQQFMPAFYG